MLGGSARIGGCFALMGGVGLLVNPVLASDAVPDTGAVLNALLPAYAVPATVAASALRTAALQGLTCRRFFRPL